MALPASFDRSQFGLVGTLVGTIAAGLLVAGMGGLLVHFIQQPDGMDVSAPVALTTSGQALVIEDLGMGASIGDWIPDDAQSYVISIDPHDDDVFVGLATATSVDRYLADVAHTTFSAVDDDVLLWQELDGTHTPTVPTDQEFWAASSQGSHEQIIHWQGQPGNWDLVIMNLSGAPEVDVTARAGVLLTAARPFGLGLLAVGIGFGIIATVLWMLGSTHETRQYYLDKLRLHRNQDADAA